MLKKIIIQALLLVGVLIGVTACGGGSSSSGLILEGELTQGATEEHSNTLIYRHAENEPISEVKVCVLDQCSITDSEGRFGMGLPESFTSGDVLVTAEGHGIDTEFMVNLPAAENEFYLHFQHQDGKIKVHHMLVDGERLEADAHDHESEDTDHKH